MKAHYYTNLVGGGPTTQGDILIEYYSVQGPPYVLGQLILPSIQQ